MKKLPLRIFGLICIAIGIWLFAGLIPAFGEALSHAGSQREIKGVLAVPLIGLLLVAFGVIAIWKPDWLKDK